MSAERRAHARFDLALGAELRLPGAVVDAATLDVSGGGCRLQLDRLMGEGDVVELALFPVIDGIQEAGFQPLQVRAEVRWSAETEATSGLRFLAGLQFVGIGDAQAAWIDGIVARSKPAE